MSLSTDYQSAEIALARIRRLAELLDLDHPDASYQASKADQLALAARELAHDLALLGSGRRVHRHLLQAHEATAVPEAVDRSFAAWLDDHDAHHAAHPSLRHRHPPDLAPYRDRDTPPGAGWT
jgi:hypothetical protein